MHAYSWVCSACMLSLLSFVESQERSTHPRTCQTLRVTGNACTQTSRVFRSKTLHFETRWRNFVQRSLCRNKVDQNNKIFCNKLAAVNLSYSTDYHLKEFVCAESHFTTSGVALLSRLQKTRKYIDQIEPQRNVNWMTLGDWRPVCKPEQIPVDQKSFAAARKRVLKTYCWGASAGHVINWLGG